MNNNLEQIINHIEFLGYTVEKIKPKEGEYSKIATAIHRDRNNMLILELDTGVFYFKVNLITKKTSSNFEMDHFSNKLNSCLDLARFYLKEEDGFICLIFEAVFIGDYNKTSFSKFIDFFDKDQNKLRLVEKFDEIFLK